MEITDKEKQKVSGQSVELYQISGIEKRISLKIPVKKAEKVGLRHISSEDKIDEIIKLLGSPPTMNEIPWYERYRINEEKMKKGDTRSYAEVIRDLWSLKDSDGLSSREKQQKKTALKYLVDEVAFVKRLRKADAQKLIEEIMEKREEELEETG